MQITRLFEIIYILLNKETTTAKELAERFGVSTRTIYRDVDTLSLAGIPVYSERGKGGGISLLPDFVLNKSILSEQEQNEILSALLGLSAVKTVDTDRVLDKLSTVFNKTATPWLDVDFTEWSFTQESIFHDLKCAITESRITTFDYYSTYGNKTSRRVEPVQLWFKSKAWYIKAFCLEKQDVRLFKLTRIRDLSVTDEHFIKRDLVEDTGDTHPNDHRADVTLKLKIAPEMTYRAFDDFEDAKPQPDGSHIVSVTWPEDEWLYGFILSFGEHVEVLEPAHIKDIIKAKAKNILSKYL
ncbi:MAG: YafY family transcriptional regulator [Defluviitaleaceae bacterium]|nr:YafY family transcriptional regulator [Defluviitaleaceae bacterium]